VRDVYFNNLPGVRKGTSDTAVMKRHVWILVSQQGDGISYCESEPIDTWLWEESGRRLGQSVLHYLVSAQAE
jgi:hypothetical protein